MTGVVSNSTQRDLWRSHWTLGRGLAVSGLWIYALGLVLWLADHWQESKVVEDVCNWVSIPADLVALALVGTLLGGSVTHGARRCGWWLLLSSLAIDLVATLAWTPFGPTTPYQYRLLADILYQLYYPLLTGTFALFFLSCGGSLRRPQFWLDALIVVLSIFAALWAIVYESPLAARGDPSVSSIPKLSYTLGISFTMTMTLLLFMQITDWRSERATLQLVAAVFVGLLADLAWLAVNAVGSAALGLTYTLGNSIFDAGHVIFCALLAGAAAAEHRRPLISRTVLNPIGPQYSLWPGLALLLTITLLVGSSATQHGLYIRVMVALAFVGAVLLVVRERGVRNELRRLNLDLAAREAEAHLTELVRSSTDVIVVVNAQRALAFVSPAVERMLGVPATDLQSTPAAGLLGAQNEAIVGQFLDGLFTVPAKATEIELRITTPAGTAGAVHVVGRNALESPRIRGVVLTVRDVTESLRAAEQIALRRNELAHVSRLGALNELSASLGHEINQPLQSILSNAQAALLLIANDNPNLVELREILKDIVEGDRRIAAVLSELRNLLKRGESRIEALDVNELVQSVLRLLNSELLMAGVALTVTLGDGLPLISGQRIALQQVLLNLIINGCEAMADVSRGDRKLLLTTRMKGKSVLIQVIDSGPGIPADDLERVFESFFTTKNRGVGLGLSVSRLIISSHGGRLWAAANHTGLGACLCFTVPAAQRYGCTFGSGALFVGDGVAARGTSPVRDPGPGAELE
jgi:PAS domain S-box-containing protein